MIEPLPQIRREQKGNAEEPYRQPVEENPGQGVKSNADLPGGRPGSRIPAKETEAGKRPRGDDPTRHPPNQLVSA